MPTRFVIYGRVSTLQQGDNTSIPLQEELCRQFGQRRGWQLAGTFTDTESGAVLDRTGLESVFDTLEKSEADVVVVSRVDRIARDQRVFADTFERVYRAGGKVAIASDGRVFDSLLEIYHATVFPRAVAEHERLTIRERTESALKKQIGVGGWIGSVCYGYELVKRADGAKQPIPHNEQAKVVQHIFNQVIAGETTRAIALDLTKRGIRTGRHGVAWHNSAVRNILARGPAYAGEELDRTWTVGGHLYELHLSYPPLISRQTAEDARRLVATRTRKPENTSPFRGLVTCARCGSTGGATSAKGAKGARDRVHFYTCRSERRSRYHRSMGLPFQKDFCRHTVDHRLISNAVLKFLTDLDPETGASPFLLGTNRVLDLLSGRKTHLAELEGKLSTVAADRSKLEGNLLEAASLGTLPKVAEVFETKLAELLAIREELDAALTADRREINALERALETLGVDTSVELASAEGTFVVDLEGLERRWKAFQDLADQLEGALRKPDFDEVRRLMWLLGLHVKIDFSRLVLRGTAGTIQVEMDLARLNRSSQEEAESYNPYSVPDQRRPSKTRSTPSS